MKKDKLLIEKTICKFDFKELHECNKTEAVTALADYFDRVSAYESAYGLKDIQIKWDVEYSYSELIFVGYRGETDAEYMKRTDGEKWEAEMKRTRQYNEFIRLKEIFEPTDAK